MAKLVGALNRKEEILNKIQDCVDYVSANCFYCNNCWHCLVTKKFQKEASKKKLKTSTNSGGRLNGKLVKILLLFLFLIRLVIKNGSCN